MQLTVAERIILDILTIPLVATADGGIEPIPAERIAAIWRAALVEVLEMELA